MNVFELMVFIATFENYNFGGTFIRNPRESKFNSIVRISFSNVNKILH